MLAHLLIKWEFITLTAAFDQSISFGNDIVSWEVRNDDELFVGNDPSIKRISISTDMPEIIFGNLMVCQQEKCMIP